MILLFGSIKGTQSKKNLCNRILGFVNAPALMQRIVAQLNDVSVAVDVYKNRRDIFIKGLRDAGYTFTDPEGAFYLFVKTPTDDDVSFVRHLQKYNILAVPGTGFGGPGYFRLAYCVSESFGDRIPVRIKRRKLMNCVFSQRNQTLVKQIFQKQIKRFDLTGISFDVPDVSISPKSLFSCEVWEEAIQFLMRCQILSQVKRMHFVRLCPAFPKIQQNGSQ